MAQKYDDTHYCTFTHIENGRTLHRRIHEMHIQARNGRLYRIHGNQLPDAITTCAGKAYERAHVADILLNPNRIRHNSSSKLLEVIEKCPKARDLLAGIIAIVGFLLIDELAEFIRAIY